jgi:hypothetical protein
MAKLKNIIRQLSAKDYQVIFDNLTANNAEKSAFLLKYIRDNKLTDDRIMQELEVNTNAYYTLRSRLNQRIEEYLLQQLETPRTDLLKKVANIPEVVFTKKKAIAIATLKKIEKELLDYDLSNELTIVYKNLKKLHINTPDGFTYSQLYNRHVAYMLALDKSEDLLAEYFLKYGNYQLSGNPLEKQELGLLKNELDNVCRLYQSHRLYVYQNCVAIFHKLFVEPGELEKDEAVDDTLANVERIFETYFLDSIYFNLKLVFEFLKLEYFSHYKVFRKSEQFYNDVNDDVVVLLSNYSLFTFPAGFLLTKLNRSIRTQTESQLYAENLAVFDNFECDRNDIPKYVIYICYRALGCFFACHYNEAQKWLNNLLNEISLKKFPQALIEVKLLLTLQYCLMKEQDLFNQNVSSMQRQIRQMGDLEDHCSLFIKLMKASNSDHKEGKEARLKAIIERINELHVPQFSPIKIICSDANLLNYFAHL